VKPNPKLFTSCLNSLGVAPENSIHIGDSFKSDIVGAIDTGMRVIWVKTREQVMVPGYFPVKIIKDLSEFPDALKELE
jgi:FMN phosphatase YigB (HAD superfamily)